MLEEKQQGTQEDKAVLSLQAGQRPAEARLQGMDLWDWAPLLDPLGTSGREGRMAERCCGDPGRRAEAGASDYPSTRP